MKYLGSSYATAKQAAKAYDKEAIKLRRPFSSLNYPKKAPVGYTPIHYGQQLERVLQARLHDYGSARDERMPPRAM